MKDFDEPKIEVILFNGREVITSTSGNGDDDYGYDYGYGESGNETGAYS